MTPRSPGVHPGLRNTVGIVAMLNLAYFAVEFAVARQIQSVSLFADSVDFFEDAAVNFLVLVALAWSAKRRARVGMALAGLLIVPAAAMLWAIWEKVHAPSVPEPLTLSVTGVGALAVNVACAFLLARFRNAGGSLTRAAYLSARNDALANVAIISAGAVTFFSPSIWPDVIVGLCVAWLNLDAAQEVWEAAKSDAADTRAAP